MRLHRTRPERSEVTAVAPGDLVQAVGRVLGTSGPQGDSWEQLLRKAGLEQRDEQPLPGRPLTPAQAERLLGVLLNKPVTLDTFPSRMGVGFLLRQVLEQGAVPREELVRRVQRFTRVVVLRPDGYLAAGPQRAHGAEGGPGGVEGWSLPGLPVRVGALLRQ